MMAERGEHIAVRVGGDRLRLWTVRHDADANAKGRRLLLIHGNPSHLGRFDPMVPALVRHGSVVAYDQAGFGRSEDFADGRPTLERSAALALALLDAIGWQERVDVVGHSHGGLVALAIGALAPDRVKTLVMLGTAGTPAHLSYRLLRVPGLDRALPWLARLLFRSRRLARVARRAVELGAWSSFEPDPVPSEFVEDELQALAARPELLIAMTRLVHDDPCAKVAALAAQVRAPTLFIHGAGDRLVPIAYPRRLFSLVKRSSPDSDFAEVPGGHMVHWQHPERVNPLLDRWLARHRT